MKISKTFTFDSAHRLPNVPDGHKCKRLHGHTYCVTIEVEGKVDEKMGWVMDFGDLKDAFKPIMLQLDHYYLNDIEGLENPTAEVMAVWIWDRLKPTLPLLSKIFINETCNTEVTYCGK